jgi:hypothetical protein
MMRQPHQAKETGDEVGQFRQAQWNGDAAKMLPPNQATRTGDGAMSTQAFQTRKNADEATIRPSRQAKKTGDEACQLRPVQRNADTAKMLPLNQAKGIGDEAMTPQFRQTWRYADAATIRPSLQAKRSVV